MKSVALAFAATCLLLSACGQPENTPAAVAPASSAKPAAVAPAREVPMSEEARKAAQAAAREAAQRATQSAAVNKGA